MAQIKVGSSDAAMLPCYRLAADAANGGDLFPHLASTSTKPQSWPGVGRDGVGLGLEIIALRHSPRQTPANQGALNIILKLGHLAESKLDPILLSRDKGTTLNYYGWLRGGGSLALSRLNQLSKLLSPFLGQKGGSGGKRNSSAARNERHS
jgi:hypothetical protein